MTDKTLREQELMLAEIEQTFHAPLSPPMMWVARYPPLLQADSEIDLATSFARCVWILDENGLREEDIWKWQRFVAVHFVRFWATGMNAPPNSMFGRTHEIGWAVFAPYHDSDLYYLESVRGHTNGMASVLTFQDSSRHLQKRLWVS